MLIGTLDALLVFLAGRKGRSGYDIRQLFQSTPLGQFSDSPGSIYPSLARLEARGLLKSAVAEGGRRRRSYRHTPAGEKALRAWLGAPIATDDVKRRPGEIELRFVMTAEAAGWSPAMEFAGRAEAAFTAHLGELEGFLAGPGATMSRASRAAMDLGIRVCRARIQWCRDLRSSRGKP